MTELQLQNLIAAGESETLEFKESFRSETINTAVAFANTRGGMILLGVDNRGNAVGTEFGTEVLSEIVNRIAGATEPSVIPDITKVDLDGTTILILSIAEYPLKPVSVRGRCFRRVGSSNRQMSPQEIARMHLAATGTSWDALPARRKSITDIDLERVADYMGRATRIGRRKFAGADPLEVLRKLELVLDGDHPTWAAILLFGKHPQSPLIQAKVHCGRFRGGTNIMDDRLIEGSLIDQIEETVDFIKKHINVEFVITGKPQRDEVWDYPLPALREAVTNAVCHRDYADSADIQIKVFDDGIRIWNPGFLPFDLSVEQLMSGDYSSKPRNKLIAQVFYDLEIIERYGSGIGRVRNACREAGLPAPEIDEQAGGFTYTFQKSDIVGRTTGDVTPHVTPHVTPQVTPHVERLIQTISGEMSRPDLMATLELKDRMHFSREYLQPSLAGGVIEMTIPDKPKSRMQKYRLTVKGKKYLENLEAHETSAFVMKLRRDKHERHEK